MIKATRGLIKVLDREKLKNTANGSYGLAESEYQRMIGVTVRGSDPEVVPFRPKRPARHADRAAGIDDPFAMGSPLTR